MRLLSSDDLFSKLTFSKTFSSKTVRVSNYLGLGQDRRSVGPDSGPNCLQRLSADNKSRRLSMERAITRQDSYIEFDNGSAVAQW